MWIEVIDGTKTLWLHEKDCRNSQGLACSRTTTLIVPPVPEPPPAWFRAPQRSLLRDASSFGIRGYPSVEYRSMAAGLDEVLEFYRESAREGGLTTTHELQMPPGRYLSRYGPGFDADGEDYRFSLDAFSHHGITFWTIQHASKAAVPPRPPRVPYQLKMLGTQGNIAQLFAEFTGEHYTASIDAFLDAEPVVTRPPLPEERPILWTSVPEWVRFAVKPTRKTPSHGLARLHANGDWRAAKDEKLKGNPKAHFEACLSWLDQRGFDGSGEHPDRSYYVSLLQGGASLNLHACSEAGDSVGLTVLNTLGHLSTHIRYTPPQGVPAPSPANS